MQLSPFHAASTDRGSPKLPSLSEALPGFSNLCSIDTVPPQASTKTLPVPSPQNVSAFCPSTDSGSHVSPKMQNDYDFYSSPGSGCSSVSSSSMSSHVFPVHSIQPLPARKHHSSAESPAPIWSPLKASRALSNSTPLPISGTIRTRPSSPGSSGSNLSLSSANVMGRSNSFDNSSSLSSEDSKSHKRKREDDDESQFSVPPRKRKEHRIPQPVNASVLDARTHHNVTEKNRRDRLRHGFEQLRRTLPLEEDNPRMSKIAILDQSFEYIQKLQMQCNYLMKENVTIRREMLTVKHQPHQVIIATNPALDRMIPPMRSVGVNDVRPRYVM